MAEKSTKKATAVTKVTEDTLMKLKSDLLLAQKSRASGELVNPRVIKSLKKDIARELTVRSQSIVKESK